MRKVDLQKLSAMAKDHRSCFGRGFTGRDPKTGRLYLCGCVARKLDSTRDAVSGEEKLDLTPILLDEPAAAKVNA